MKTEGLQNTYFTERRMHMRKIFSMILCFAIMAVNFTAVSAKEDDVTVTLDGNEIDFPDAKPFIDSRARTLVPIRFVSEAMGANVDWDNETKTVSIIKDRDTVTYTIGEFKGYINRQLMPFDTCGILKEDRTFVPLRYISELLDCQVDWEDDTNTVRIKSPGEAVEFPEPEITVHYPESESDKRLFWITVDNYRDYERNCPNYEFKIDFISPEEFNDFEQDEGAILGWQLYNRNNFTKIAVNGGTIFSVGRAYYGTRESMKSFKPYDGMDMNFKLTVIRKCSGDTREYKYSEKLSMPYDLVTVEV